MVAFFNAATNFAHMNRHAAWWCTLAGMQNVALVPGVQGLEKEYDRLLAENDDLKQQLAKFQPSFGINAAGGRKDR